MGCTIEPLRNSLYSLGPRAQAGSHDALHQTSPFWALSCCIGAPKKAQPANASKAHTYHPPFC